MKSRTDSNAKSIEALTNTVKEDRETTKKPRDVQLNDRAHVFEWMARLAAAQADYLQHVEQSDDKLAEILHRLTFPEK